MYRGFVGKVVISEMGDKLLSFALIRVCSSFLSSGWQSM